MGEEQGLSAENEALILRVFPQAAKLWKTHDAIPAMRAAWMNALLNAARSEGLHPPVGVEEEVFSSLGASKAPSSASAGVAETPSGGWINWGGGPNPVPGAEVFWRNASGETGMCPADELWGWSAPGHSNRVVAYCVIGQTPGGEA